MLVLIPWSNNTVRKVRLVDAVRELLCLQTEPSVFPVLGSVLPSETVVRWYEVPGVELDPWLVCEALQPPPRPGVNHPAHEVEATARVGQHKVVVEPVVVSARTFLQDVAQPGGGPQVEDRPGHGGHSPGGDELVRHRGETVGGHRHDVVIETFNMVVILSLSEPVITCCPCLVSSQVEVDVVGEVDGSGGRHHGSELDLQSSLGVQTVQDVVENVSRISLVSVRTEVREGDGAGLLTDSSAPVDLVQSHQTSVESVGSIVLGVRLSDCTHSPEPELTLPWPGSILLRPDKTCPPQSC